MKTQSSFIHSLDHVLSIEAEDPTLKIEILPLNWAPRILLFLKVQDITNFPKVVFRRSSLPNWPACEAASLE